MGIIRVNELPEGSGSLSNDDIFIFMDDPSGGGTTKKISLSQISSAIGGGGGSGNPFDQNLNTTDSPEFVGVSLTNGTTLAQGTFDNSTGGQSGISLNCYVGYELNWQGGHLKSTPDGGITTANIWCDSPIEFQGAGIDNVEINATGLVFSDGTTQTTAYTGIPVKDIIAGSGISVSGLSGIYTISSNLTSVAESNSLVTNVFNKTGSSIAKFNVVYITGGQGDQPTIGLAVASGEMTSSKTYGITAENIGDMSAGKVIVFGALTGVNTDQFNPTAPTGDVNGTTLWLSPTTPGGVTTTKPSAPYHAVAVGTIVRTHQNQGVVEVRVQNGYELEELHNVAISGVTNGQFLQYNSGSGLWIPTSSGNFTTLQVSGTNVSVSGHTHTASNITDFNSSVSGLLPVTNIIGNSGIVVSNSGSAYTISQSGLIKSDTTSIAGASGVLNIVQISQSGYNALGSTDPYTMYVIIN